MVRKVTYDDEIEINGTKFAINNGPGYGCWVEIIEGFARRLDSMLSYHNKVLCFRVDLKVYEYSNENSQIRQLFNKLNQRKSGKLNLKRIAHQWVREVETSKKQHYHVWVMVDGNRLKSPFKLLTLIQTIWENMGHPTPTMPSKPTYVVRRDDRASYADVIQRASYDAKKRGKGYKAKSAKNFGGSRIRIK